MNLAAAAHARTLACELTSTEVITRGTAPRSTAELTGGVARGDPRAFEELYREWFPRCVAIARARTGRDESFCLDVAQDVMLKVARTLPALRTEQDLSRWLTRAVITGAIDAIRRERRTQTRDQRAAQHERSEAAGGIKPELDALMKQLDALGHEDRWLLLHRFAHQLEHATIGRLMGLSGDAVSGRVRRALGRLRAAKGEGEVDE